jgi:stage II sporulation protein M
MRQVKLQLHRLNVVQIAIILLICGLFFGVLSANIFSDSYLTQLQEYQNSVFANISESDIDYSGLFWYILSNNIKEFCMFWLLSITILGIPYMALKICAFGFYTGFFISAVTMRYGMKGLLLVLAYKFPHGLIYLPIVIISLFKGYELCKKIYHDNRSHFNGFFNIIKPYFFLLIILAITLLIGSFLEAYAGSYILKKVIRLFSS